MTRANDTEYTAVAYLYADYRGMRVSEKLDFGMIGLNRGRLDPAAPFGGMKQSGIGREGTGLMEFWNRNTFR